MKIKSISPAGKADVFNMEVDDTHNFVIQGGVIAHNCADSIRYFCMMRPIAARGKGVNIKEKYDPLDIFKETNNNTYHGSIRRY